MSSFSRPYAAPALLARSLAVAALLSGTMLMGALTAARADTVPATQAAGDAAMTKAETVEQRITSLHSALRIGSAQDARWNDVAQAMRENAANMEKLVAANRETPQQEMTAVDDLKTYGKFAQAHVDGLKNLTAAFEKLYETMPDDQKKNADEVFRTSRREGARS